ncbi:MAG: cob(I)yrinic acid a,c-diamide adenosyltransferase [bacterium]|nr:cob(I)yrinic acid a,c-diamide adenosyltransferase [bacterium]
MRTKFFTGAGDGGKSALGKKSFRKDDPFFEVLGTLDELNSWVGFCRVSLRRGKTKRDVDTAAVLLRVQEILFVMQAEAAGIFFKSPKYPILRASATAHLEDTINRIDAILPPLTKFIIPGGSELSAKLDIARTVARRAERLAVGYSKKTKLSHETLQFLNRLSSLLFALARHENFKKNIKEDSPSYT